MPTTPAIIFDMDGVLVDSEPLHTRAWEQVFGVLGEPLGTRWFERWIGIADRLLAAEWAPRLNPPLAPADLVARKRAALRVLLQSELRAFPGVVEGVAAIRARLAPGNGQALPPAVARQPLAAAAGHGLSPPLAVATSSARSEAELCLTVTGLRDSFPVVLSGDDVARLKPAPDLFLAAAAALGRPPATCWVIEDSRPGVAAARAAGCRVLAVTHTHPAADLAAAAERVFPTTAAAIAWLLAEVLPQ